MSYQGVEAQLKGSSTGATRYVQHADGMSRTKYTKRRQRAGGHGWPETTAEGSPKGTELKAEIDEEKTEAFWGTESLPFEPGNRKTVAVKIVDDRGIESLKIIRI